MAGGKGKSSGGKSSGGKTSGVDGSKKQQSHSARAGLQVCSVGIEYCIIHALGADALEAIIKNLRPPPPFPTPPPVSLRFPGDTVFSYGFPSCDVAPLPPMRIVQTGASPTPRDEGHGLPVASGRRRR
jgi:hypothetical protein